MSLVIASKGERQPRGSAGNGGFAVEHGEIGIRQCEMGFDNIGEFSAACGIAGGLKAKALLGEGLESITRAHPLFMVHDMIGKPRIELRHQDRKSTRLNSSH